MTPENDGGFLFAQPPLNRHVLKEIATWKHPRGTHVLQSPISAMLSLPFRCC